MDGGISAIATTLVGISGGLATWFMGLTVFAAFIGGIVFTLVGVYLVSEAM